MKKLKYLFMIVISMTLMTSCDWGDTSLDDNDKGANLAYFQNTSQNLAAVADGAEYQFDVQVKMVGPTIMDLTEDITVTFFADDASTAVEGTHFRLDNPSITLTKANNYLGIYTVTMLTEGIETPLDENPVLLLRADASGADNVEGSGKPTKLNLIYACPSDLEGAYTVEVLRDGAPIAPYVDEYITETGIGEYRTSHVGHWFDLGVGTPGYTFIDVCGVLTVPEQLLVDYYGNVVHGDESPPGSVDEDTGVLTITYKITSSWESEYACTYTPVK